MTLLWPVSCPLTHLSVPSYLSRETEFSLLTFRLIAAPVSLALTSSAAARRVVYVRMKRDGYPSIIPEVEDLRVRLCFGGLALVTDYDWEG